MLSMHELSLSMPEPMLSLSMLILATYPEAALVLRHADPVRPRTMLDEVPRMPRTAVDAVSRVPRTASNAVPRVPRWTRSPAYRVERGHPRTAYRVRG